MSDQRPDLTDAAATSQPEGQGPVTLEDRTDGGAPDTNQATTEPMSPTPDHPEPVGAPTIAEMNVGAGDPQAPNHASAAPREAVAPGAPPGDLSRPGPPAQHAGGTVERAPGQHDDAPDGESVETDVAAGAARMAEAGSSRTGTDGHGDTASAPAAGDGPLAGSSQTQVPVEGVRQPSKS